MTHRLNSNGSGRPKRGRCQKTEEERKAPDSDLPADVSMGYASSLGTPRASSRLRLHRSRKLKTVVSQTVWCQAALRLPYALHSVLKTVASMTVWCQAALRLTYTLHSDELVRGFYSFADQQPPPITLRTTIGAHCAMGLNPSAEQEAGA